MSDSNNSSGDDDDAGESTNLLPIPANDDQVSHIEFGEGKPTFFVTQKAKMLMSSSMDAMANQPTIFHKMDFIMQAVADAVDEDKTETSFSHAAEQLQGFNWNDVTIGRQETHLTQVQPEADVFKKVKAIHKLVKPETCEEARVMGLPKSGVQAWSTCQQRWGEWRELCAVCRSMSPEEDKQMVFNRIKGQCKLVGSLETICSGPVKLEMKKHMDKLKREDQKHRAAEKVEAELERTEEEVAKATQKAGGSCQARANQGGQEECEKHSHWGHQKAAASS